VIHGLLSLGVCPWVSMLDSTRIISEESWSAVILSRAKDLRFALQPQLQDQQQVLIHSGKLAE
jgi:hypothetical protein